MTKDIRVVLIKLADRTHNMRTLGSLRPDKRVRIAKETLEIYSPLAHRLGITHLKNELEDLCFKAMYPHRYNVLKMAIEMARGTRQDLLATISHELESRLKEVGIPARIYGREKHITNFANAINVSDRFWIFTLSVWWSITWTIATEHWGRYTLCINHAHIK